MIPTSNCEPLDRGETASPKGDSSTVAVQVAGVHDVGGMKRFRRAPVDHVQAQAEAQARMDAERLRRGRHFSYTLLTTGLRREGRGTTRQHLAATGGDDELETGKENGDDH